MTERQPTPERDLRPYLDLANRNAHALARQRDAALARERDLRAAVEAALIEWERGVGMLTGYPSDRVRAAEVVLNAAASSLRAALAAHPEPDAETLDPRVAAVRRLGILRGGSAPTPPALTVTREQIDQTWAEAERRWPDADEVHARARATFVAGARWFASRLVDAPEVDRG